VTSEYQRCVDEWRNCDRCLLCNKRNNVVQARGTIPCRVLFVGESPGDSEDVLGRPFVGPAGRLLDYVVEQSLGDKYPVAMINLVGCIPRDESNAKGEPPKEAIVSCRPRLQRIMELCDPSLIVAVGLLSLKHAPKMDDVMTVSITHPAAILRMDVSQQALAIKRCVITVESAAALYL